MRAAQCDVQTSLSLWFSLLLWGVSSAFFTRYAPIWEKHVPTVVVIIFVIVAVSFDTVI